MTRVAVKEQELNELRWWSHWAKVLMLDETSYIITSPVFQEPLFNHATIVGDKRNSVEAIDRAVKLFRDVGVPPSFFVIDDRRYEGAKSALMSSGFSSKDMLEVMVAKRALEYPETSVKMAEANADVSAWVKSYVASFYDGDAPVSAIESAAANAAKDKDASLLVARRGEEVLGQLALFRQGGLLGAYCVGTIPLHRRSGVAGQMLAYAIRGAEKQNLRLVLQTFASDDLAGFYSSRGFETVYRKLVMLPER